MAGLEGNEHARRLGAELRTRRLARGMSLRTLAKQLGLGGHGTLVDYEHGRRIPPEDLIVGCERIFRISDGALRNLREKALAERANEQADKLLREPPTEELAAQAEIAAPAAAEPPGPVARPSRRGVRRRWLVVAAVAVLLVAGGTAAALLRTGPSAADTSAPSQTVVASWSTCWGEPLIQLRTTATPGYKGTKALEITVTEPNSKGDVAVCTAHNLDTLHSGMKVTAWLQSPSPEAGDGVRFWVYDNEFHPHYAPETPASGADMLLPDGSADWTPYTFTVPTVDRVHTLGMEIYSGTSQPAILWLGAVTWGQ